MKVLIIGLPSIAKKLASKLSEFDTSNVYKSLNTYYRVSDKLRFLYYMKNYDVLYSINGSVFNSKAFDIALQNNKKLIMHWVGTDVIKAVQNYKKGNINTGFINNAKHFCVSGWIREELNQIGIDAEIQNFLSFDDDISVEQKLPDTFSVLAYIGKNREIFYGMNEIIKLANKYDDIPFYVVGIEKYKEKLPENIKLSGWVNDMDNIYTKSVLCIRFPKHDGLSGFVLEALSKGRYVAYKYDLPHCIHTPDFNSLINAVGLLKARFDNNELELNQNGIEYISQNYNQKLVLSGLINALKTACH